MSSDAFPLVGAIIIAVVIALIVGARLHGARNRLKFALLVLGCVLVGSVSYVALYGTK
jgi:uncharacterized membrane protein AbrB (regulator of aidB expression)